MQAKIFKENSLNKLNALKSTAQLLENQSIWYQQAFARLFGDSFRTFTFQLSQHMNNLETLLNAETLHEMDSKSALIVDQNAAECVKSLLKSVEKEIDELEFEKADFSNMYDLLLEECVSKDVICSYLDSLSDLNANSELQCLYLHKVKECECLALKLSKRTKSITKEVHNNLIKSFAKLDKQSITLELSLQNIVKEDR
ncbi:hypothetical protein Tco_0226538 [Tanacetum coccineum]